VSDLCRQISGLQAKAKEQAQTVSSSLENPNKLIASLKEQIDTVTSLQQCVTDLANNKSGLTGPDLDKLKQTFKELAALTEQNHKQATQKGIRLTPKVHPGR